MSEKRRQVVVWNWTFRLYAQFHTGPRLKPRAMYFAFAAFFSVNAFGAEVDVSKLPPAAATQVDFTAEIQPILRQNCLKCHGSERPKGHFRLDDRASALKGGDNNSDDIVPGDSARSRLIHYVAHVVPDMEMPPTEQGEALSPREIGLLRAWIDQGAQWGWELLEPEITLALTPAGGFTSVHGDNAKFRENNWMRDSWRGGIESFEGVQQLSSASRLTFNGHAMTDDYQMELLGEKQDFGFVHFGWQQFRKYYDDSGGYDPSSGSVTDLGKNLHLDIGKAWADFGLTLPDLPQITLGYEYQYRQGDKSTLQWGAMPPNVTNNVLPNAKNISEHVHIIKVDLNHEVAGVHIENNFRGEFYDLRTRQVNDAFVYDIAAPTPVTERASHFQGANVLRLEKQITGWLYASGNYLYSKLDGDGSVNLDTASWSSVPSVITHVDLDRESHVFGVNSLLGPWNGFSLTAAVQNEWTRQHGFGDANANLYLPVDIVDDPINYFSYLDKMTTEENVALRFTRIPFTIIFAEARFQQECIGQHESEDAPVDQFLRDTDATSDLKNFHVGFSTSPWRSASWSAHYRHNDKETDYDHSVDTSLFGGEGYSAFITSREISSQEVETKLTIRPASWLKTTLSYKLVTTDYHTDTDPIPSGSLPSSSFTSDYDAHVYSVGATWTPWRRLYMSSMFSYKDARTRTVTGPGLPIAPYRGDVYSVMVNGTWAANPRTDLLFGYLFSLADFSQSNVDGGVPYGIEYQQHGVHTGFRRKHKNGVTTGLQYAYYYYDEPSSGGHNDYSAHLIFFSLSYKLP